MNSTELLISGKEDYRYVLSILYMFYIEGKSEIILKARRGYIKKAKRITRYAMILIKCVKGEEIKGIQNVRIEDGTTLPMNSIEITLRLTKKSLKLDKSCVIRLMKDVPKIIKKKKLDIRVAPWRLLKVNNFSVKFKLTYPNPRNISKFKKIILHEPSSTEKILFEDYMENPPQEIEVNEIGKYYLSIEYKSNISIKKYFQVKPDIKVLRNEIQTSQPKLIVQVNKDIPLVCVDFSYEDCIEPLELVSKKRDENDPTKIIFEFKRSIAQKILNFVIKVVFNGVENRCFCDLSILPFIKLIKFEPKKDFYFPEEKLNFTIESSNNIVNKDFQIKSLIESLYYDIRRIDEDKFEINLIIPSNIDSGEYTISISILKNGVNSKCIEKLIRIKLCLINFKQSDGLYFSGNIIDVSIYSPIGDPKAFIKEIKRNEILAFPLSISEMENIYTGKIELLKPGFYVIEANNSFSEEFKVYPYMQLSCPLLRKNKNFLLKSSEDYILKLKTNSRIPDSNIWLSVTDTNNNLINQFRYNFTDISGNIIETYETDIFRELKINIKFLTSKLQILSIGKYQLQITIPPGRKSIEFTLPPLFEFDKAISGIFRLSDTIDLSFNSQINSTITIDLKAELVPEQFIFPLFKRNSQKKLKMHNESITINLNLNPLAPGLLYNISGYATFNKISSQLIDIGKFGIVEAFTYEKIHFINEEPLLLVYCPPKVKIRVNDNQITNKYLPYALLYLNPEMNEHFIYIENEFFKKITINLKEKVPKTFIAPFLIEKLIIDKDKQYFPKFNDFSLITSIIKELISDPSTKDILFVNHSSKNRAKSYMMFIEETLKGEFEFGTKAIIIFPSNGLFQDQISEIIKCIMKIDKSRNFTVGLFPSPTPYKKMFFNLNKALWVEENQRISPNIPLICPKCEKSGEFVITRINEQNILICMSCNCTFLNGQELIETLKIEGELIKGFDLDEFEKKIYVKGQNHRYGPYNYYIPILFNLVLKCPKCGDNLIPACKKGSDFEKEKHFLLCITCGLNLDFFIFTLNMFKEFMPNLIITSFNFIRWLFNTPRGEQFNYLHGKIRMCNKCGRVHPLAKEIWHLEEDFLTIALHYIKNQFPILLLEYYNEHNRYLQKKKKKSKIIQSFSILLEIENTFDNFKKNIINIGIDIEENIEEWFNEQDEFISINETNLITIKINQQKNELRKCREEFDKLELQINSIKDNLKWQKKFKPLLKFIYIILNSLKVKWEPLIIKYEKLEKDYLIFQIKIEEIETVLISLQDEALTKDKKIEESYKLKQFDLLNLEIKNIKNLENIYRTLLINIKKLLTELNLEYNSLSSLNDIEKTIILIRNYISLRNKSLYRSFLEDQKSEEIYDHLRSSWKKKIVDWMFEKINTQESYAGDILSQINDVVNCLKVCGFINHLYQITSKGLRYLEGDFKLISSCQCGGNYNDFESKLKLIVFDDVHQYWINHFDNIRKDQVFELIQKIKRKLPTKLLICSRDAHFIKD